MDYPFDIENIRTKEHQVYKRTFLQNTFVELRFLPQFSEDRLWLKKVRSFVANYFHLDIGDNHNFQEELILTNKDDDIAFRLATDSVEVRVGRKRYKSFSISVMPHIYLLKSYIQQVVQTDVVTSIGVRKINLWPISADAKETINDEQLYQAIFSNPFMQIETEKMVVDGLEFDIVQYEHKETSLNLGRAINNEPSQRVVILNSRAEAQQTTPTSINDMEAKMEELDGILFEAYHWCVNENIINLMKEN